MLLVSSSLGRDEGAGGDLLRGGFPPFRETPYTQLAP
jgi:hypothetical protein